MPCNRPLKSVMVNSCALFTCAAIGCSASAVAHTDVHIGLHVDVAALFRAIDANHDGQISQTEYTAHANRVFGQCDTNGDGKLSAQELQACTTTMNRNGIPVSGSSTQTLKAMDASHGLVSQSGYDAYADKDFRKLDTNHDGTLSPTELRGGVQGPASASSTPHATSPLPAAPAAPAPSGQPARH